MIRFVSMQPMVLYLIKSYYRWHQFLTHNVWDGASKSPYAICHMHDFNWMYHLRRPSPTPNNNRENDSVDHTVETILFPLVFDSFSFFSTFVRFCLLLYILEGSNINTVNVRFFERLREYRFLLFSLYFVAFFSLPFLRMNSDKM